MRRPLVMVAMAYLAGILVAELLPLPWYVYLVGAGLTMVLSFWQPGKGRGGSRLPWLLAAFIFVSALRLYWWEEVLIRGWLPFLQQREVEVVGTVARPPERREDRVFYVLRVEEVDRRRVAGTLLLQLGPVREGTGTGTRFSFGDRLRTRGTLRQPRDAGNPGEFDYRAYLARQGVGATLSPARGAYLESLGPARVNFLRAATMRAQERMVANIRGTLPEPHASLLVGIVMGGSGGLPEEVRDDWRRAGVFHLLAVSGSNVAFVTLLAAGAAWILRLPRQAGLVFSVAAVLFYAFMTGAEVSVVRAAVMALAALVGKLLYRDVDSYNSLALAGLVIMAYQPLAPFDAGFQLSFGATLGILTLASPLEKGLKGRLSFLPRGVNTALAVTLAAQLAVAPVTVYYFNEVSLASLLANLVALPLAGALVISGFTAGLAGFFSLPAAATINLLNRTLLSLLLQAVHLCSRLPLAALSLSTPATTTILFYYLALAWGGGLWRPSFLPRPGFWRERVVVFTLAVATLSVWTRALGPAPDILEVVFLDVGQGDSTFIRLPGGITMLVDAGPRVESPDYTFDAGERVIVPFLRRKGIRRLDILVVSHGHDDHFGGAEAVLRSMPVGAVWGPPLPEEVVPGQAVAARLRGGEETVSPQFLDFIELIREKGIPYYAPKAGEVARLGPAEIEFFLPPPVPLQGTRSDSNNNSLVFRLQYRGIGFLFTGDVEAEGEKQAMAAARGSGRNLSATVLKVPHHGSNLSSTGEFLKAVSPRVAVIQVGTNPYGLPGRETLARLEAARATVYRSDLDGAVVVETDGLTYRVFTRRRPAAGIILLR